MKIRSGFVSNSSSSSFIIGLTKKPETKEELMKIMFPNNQKTIGCYGKTMSCSKVAGIVFGDLSKEKEKSESEIIQEILIGSDSYNGDINDECMKESYDFEKNYYNINKKKIWDDSVNLKDREVYNDLLCAGNQKYDKMIKRKVKEFWETQKNKFKNLKIYILEYGDGVCNGILEHGNIFKNIPNIKVSKH